MKTIKIIIALLLIGSFVNAQTISINNDLKTLINQSFSYFPKMKELQQQVQTNTYREEGTKSGYLPTISANAGYMYVAPVSQVLFPSGPGQFTTLYFQPNNNFTSAVTLNQTLYDFGKVKANVEKAKDDIKISKANIDANKALLAAQVANIYYSTIYIKKAMDVQDSLLVTLQESKKLIDSRVKNGDAIELDALTVKNNIDNANNRKADLQNMLDKQTNLLYYTVGQTKINTTSQTNFDFNVGSMLADSATATAQKTNADVILTKLRIDQAKHDINVNKAAALPVLSLNGAIGYKNGYQPDIFQVRFNYLVGVNLSVPLYQGGRYLKQTKVAESTLLQNQFSLESTNNTLRRDIAQALDDIKLNEEKVKNTTGMVQQAELALKIAKSRYKNGTIIYVELFTAQNNLQSAQLSKLQYEYQLCLAKIELTRLTGATYWM
jgi:outer membrane protein TolC